MKQIFIYYFSLLLITSCAGNKEHSWSSASASSAMVENDTVGPEEVIPEELDEFVVTSQGGSGAHVKESPSSDSPTIMTYPDGTTFTGAYTDVPRWIMIVKDNHIVGYIHDHYVSKTYDDEFIPEVPEASIELEGDEQTNQIESQIANNQNREIEEIKSWIQGSWYYSTIIMGTRYTSIITIAGDNITAKTNGELDYSGPYEIDLDYEGLRYNYNTGKRDIIERFSRIHYSDIYIIIDTERRRLKVDENNYYNRL